MSELENITILFHDTYEEVSKKYGYQTREDTKVFDMESPNGKTMYETVEKIMTPYLQKLEKYKNIVDEIKEYLTPDYEEYKKLIDKRDYLTDINDNYWLGVAETSELVLDKLKELKGE